MTWKTRRTKDGRQKLDKWFYACNPRYIEAHKEWEWVEVPPSTTGQNSPDAAAVPGEATTPVKHDEARTNNPAVCPTDDEERLSR